MERAFRHVWGETRVADFPGIVQVPWEIEHTPASLILDTHSLPSAVVPKRRRPVGECERHCEYRVVLGNLPERIAGEERSGKAVKTVIPLRAPAVSQQNPSAAEVFAEDLDIRIRNMYAARAGHVDERRGLALSIHGCQFVEKAVVTNPGNQTNNEGDDVTLTGLVGSVDGKKMIKDADRAPAIEALKLGELLATRILEAGGKEILEEVYCREIG